MWFKAQLCGTTCKLGNCTVQASMEEEEQSLEKKITRLSKNKIVTDYVQIELLIF